MGSGASSYTASLIRASTATLRGNSDSYRLNVTYDFSKMGVAGLKGIAQYAWIDQDQVGTATATEDYRSYAAGLDYAVAALKGLTLSVQYETQEKESSTAGVVISTIDTDELRFRANYKF